MKYGFTAAVFPVSGFIGKRSSWDVVADEKHMDEAQLREISRYGIEIGSHTVTHPCLPYLDQTDLVRELTESKNVLEGIIDKRVSTISFPFGSWNDRAWSTAIEAGYNHATCYRSYSKAKKYELTPVIGIYSFDSTKSILNKINFDKKLSVSLCIAKVMAHFSKGSPLWKYRKNYTLK
jgi:peptidoglycan/xylan/chitin deacetylase (PgdA/CDA1 family)